MGDVDIADGKGIASEDDRVSSRGRLDRPKSILRKMQDNVEDYDVEAVGHVRQTHRYRGLADFQFANTRPSFLTNLAENILPMQVSNLREIKFTPGVAVGPGQEIIPPPQFSDKPIGFNYHYEQNPNIKVEGNEGEERQIINVQGRKKHSYGYFINHNKYPVPTKPRRAPSIYIPPELMNQLHALMDERPIWTRRAIMNRVKGVYSESILRITLQLVGYQFRGGPWRDAFVKYGVDPRPDPKFRLYQTLAFKLEKNKVGTKRIPWETIRKGQMKKPDRSNHNSHLWDGKSYSLDGKFWQACDITDPFVRKMIDEAPLRKECDNKDSGWYYHGTWSKVKMAMKVKMIAINKGRMGSDDDDPQKPGFLYNSFLDERLRLWPDKVDKMLGLTMEPFLRPMEEVDTRLRKPRPTPSESQGAQKEPVTSETLHTPAGQNLANRDSEGMLDNDGDMPDADEPEDLVDDLNDADRELEDYEEYFYDTEYGEYEDEDVGGDEGEYYSDDIELGYGEPATYEHDEYGDEDDAAEDDAQDDADDDSEHGAEHESGDKGKGDEPTENIYD